jgi:hypothetical protein
MPFAALAVALLVLSGPLDPAAADGPSKSALAQPAPGSLMLAFDDEIRGFRDDDDDDEDAVPDDHDYSYGDDDDDDDEGDSAHGPDDDDGWDIDEYERSERA